MLILDIKARGSNAGHAPLTRTSCSRCGCTPRCRVWAAGANWHGWARSTMPTAGSAGASRWTTTRQSADCCRWSRSA